MENTEIQAISWWKGENSKSQFISGLKILHITVDRMEFSNILE